MTKTKRITIETERYNQIKELTVRGHKVSGTLSPYDVPRQAAVAYDSEKREYRIRLIYLTPDEPTTESPVSKEVSFYLGVESGKLYEVLIRGQEPGHIKDVRLQLVDRVNELAIKSQQSSPHNYVKQLNLLAAKKFLEEKEELYTFD